MTSGYDAFGAGSQELIADDLAAGAKALPAGDPGLLFTVVSPSGG